MIHEALIDPMLVAWSIHHRTPMFVWSRVGFVSGALRTGLKVPAIPVEVAHLIRLQCEGVEVWHQPTVNTPSDARREIDALLPFLQTAVMRVTIGGVNEWEYPIRVGMRPGIEHVQTPERLMNNGRPLPEPLAQHPSPAPIRGGYIRGGADLVAEVLYQGEPWPQVTLAIKLQPLHMPRFAQ